MCNVTAEKCFCVRNGMSQIRDGWACFVFEEKVAKVHCADSPVLVC